MSILYDDGQLAIAAAAEKIVTTRDAKTVLLDLLESRGEFDQEFWTICTQQGWTGITIPEEYGGLGLSLIELGLVAEACGRTISGAPFLTTNFGAAETLLGCADERLKSTWLTMISDGTGFASIAFADRAATLPRHSELCFSGNRLSGRKPAVAGGLAAQLALVLAEKDGEPVLAAVHLNDNHVHREVLDTFDNSRLATDLVFDNSEADILLTGEAAIAQARLTLAKMAVITAYEQTGGAEALMLAARDYALERKAFGQVIGAFQSVKHKIAELYAHVQLARANAIHAASVTDTDEFLRAAAAARLTATEAYDTAARDAIQVHGGIGVSWETGLHLHQRRARTLALEGGSSTFWEDTLVDELVKEEST